MDRLTRLNRVADFMLSCDKETLDMVCELLRLVQDKANRQILLDRFTKGKRERAAKRETSQEA